MSVLETSYKALAAEFPRVEDLLKSFEDDEAVIKLMRTSWLPDNIPFHESCKYLLEGHSGFVKDFAQVSFLLWWFLLCEMGGTRVLSSWQMLWFYSYEGTN